MHSIAIIHGIITCAHIVSSVFLFMLLPKSDESSKDAMKGALGYDVLTLSGSCPDGSSSGKECSLVRTETHEDVWTGIDIIMLLAVNEAIAAFSHLVGFVGWWMSESIPRTLPSRIRECGIAHWAAAGAQHLVGTATEY